VYKIDVMPLCYVCCGIKNVGSREVVMFLVTTPKAVVSEVIFTGLQSPYRLPQQLPLRPMQVTCNRHWLDEPQPVFPYFCHS
jgi:hypothetical protein